MQRVSQLPSLRGIFLLMIALLVCPAAAFAAGPSYAVRAGRVILGGNTGDAAGIENGVLIIRDGKIERVGTADLPIPADLAILELPGQTIMPGMIAASTRLAGSHTGEPAVSGMFQAVDAFDIYSDLRPWLAAGITAVHLNPGDHRLVSGLGAVVKLGGEPSSRVLAPQADIQVNFTPEALNAPAILRLLIPPAADGMIVPPLRQPGVSRMDMRLALDHFIEQGRLGKRDDGEFSPHLQSFAQAWDANTPIRIRADRAADIAQALKLVREQSKRRSALIGGAEAAGFVDAIGSMRLSVVYEIDGPSLQIAPDRGLDADGFERSYEALAQLAADARIPLAIAPASGDPRSLRLAAIGARSPGIPDARLISAMTGDAAKVLGVDNRIGTLTPGKDADFVVLSGPPLDGQASVRRVYINGRLAYQHPAAADSVVVRGGTVWIGPGESITNGSVLIEDGKITAVGKTVPAPPGSRMIDAGPTAFITPGFIDAHGHLLYGSNTIAPPPSFEVERLIGAADGDAMRLAHAGVTTVINAPRRINNNGSRMIAVKTAGLDRESRVLTPVAAIAFDLRSGHHDTFERRIKPRYESGKRYYERWQKYYQDIEAWEKARLEGTDFEVSEDEEDAPPAEAAADDPVTGTWMMTVTSDLFPEPISGRVALTLTGDQVEGRIIEPEAAEVDHRIIGTFDGQTITGRIEVDTGGAGIPTFTLTVGSDSAEGVIELADFGISLKIEGVRTSRAMTSFKVVRKRSTTGKDGRPLPPPTDESEEPWRAVFEHAAPIAVYVNSTEAINAALNILDQLELHAVLIAPERVVSVADRVKSKHVGVVASTELLGRDYRRGGAFGEFSPLLDLARAGIPFAMQSGAADGAASLPSVGLAAVSLGLAPDQVLAALTVDAAKAYQLDDQVGVLRPGREGDVLIFDGHPFESGTRLQRVIVGGKEIAR